MELTESQIKKRNKIIGDFRTGEKRYCESDAFKKVIDLMVTHNMNIYDALEMLDELYSH